MLSLLRFLRDRETSDCSSSRRQLCPCTGPLALISPVGNIPPPKPDREVYNLAYSPDGRHLLASCSDDVILYCDPCTGKPLHTFEGHEGSVNVSTFLPNCFQFLSGSEDMSIRLWDVRKKGTVLRYDGHDEWVKSIDICPNEKHFLSYAYDNTVRKWDIDTDGTSPSESRKHLSNVVLRDPNISLFRYCPAYNVCILGLQAKIALIHHVDVDYLSEDVDRPGPTAWVHQQFVQDRDVDRNESDGAGSRARPVLQDYHMASLHAFQGSQAPSLAGGGDSQSEASSPLALPMLGELEVRADGASFARAIPDPMPWSHGEDDEGMNVAEAHADPGARDSDDSDSEDFSELEGFFEVPYQHSHKLLGRPPGTWHCTNDSWVPSLVEEGERTLNRGRNISHGTTSSPRGQASCSAHRNQLEPLIECPPFWVGLSVDPHPTMPLFASFSVCSDGVYRCESTGVFDLLPLPDIAEDKTDRASSTPNCPNQHIDVSVKGTLNGSLSDGPRAQCFCKWGCTCRNLVGEARARHRQRYRYIAPVSQVRYLKLPSFSACGQVVYLPSGQGVRAIHWPSATLVWEHDGCLSNGSSGLGDETLRCLSHPTLPIVMVSGTSDRVLAFHPQF